jgi:uracil-DNA glycosylase family 4
MAEPDPRELLLHHLASLRAAGVEWLPREAGFVPPAIELEPTPEPVQPTLTPLPVLAPTAVQTSLLAQASDDAIPETPEGRRTELDALAVRVAACVRCGELARTRTQTVFGVGPLDPDLCFLGEAPGADEDRQGEPFVGAAGQLLNRIIEASGMMRDQVFICNVLRCRPPGNRQPLPIEAENCREYLDRTLALVKPKVICALGATAVKNLLGVEQGITRLRGKWLNYRGIPVMPTFHPAYLLRSPAGKKDVWEDMKAILARLGRPIPGKAT